MKVSVAIATYNRASMVRQAIESALAQSLPPDEIVVSDDASSDDTPVVLAEIAVRDSRVHVFRQSENSGGVKNWNAAIRETRGEFIAWCSDDDRFTSDHLASSVEFLERHPEIGIVHSSFIDAIEAENCHEQVPRALRSSSPIVVSRRNLVGFMIRYYNWPFHPSTLVMRREMWRQIGEFDPAYALADTDWFVRAADVTKIAMLPRHGVINRRHAGNWSNRVGSAHMQREIFEIVEKAIAARPWFSRFLERVLWRMNVRVRLALTLRARIASGHENAARAAWRVILRNTGRHAPRWIERVGVHLICRLIRIRRAGHEPALETVRQSVSPR